MIRFSNLYLSFLKIVVGVGNLIPLKDHTPNIRETLELLRTGVIHLFYPLLTHKGLVVWSYRTSLVLFARGGKNGTIGRRAGHLGRAGGILEEVYPARGAAVAAPLDRSEAWKITNFLYMFVFGQLSIHVVRVALRLDC